MAKKVIDIFSGKDVKPSKETNYSALLRDFMTPFVNDFPDEMTNEDRIGFAMNGWNLGFMSELMSKDEFKKMLSVASFPKHEYSILKGMIELKKKKYAEYDKFIDDFDFEEKNGELIITVTTKEKEDFFSEIITKEFDILSDLYDEFDDDIYDDFDDDVEDYNEGFINRQALILKPQQPLIDWVNSLYPGRYKDSDFVTNLYLVDASIKNIDQWLKRHFKRFFCLELNEWHTLERDWPQKLTYKMFCQWFSIDYSRMIYDLESEPVSKAVIFD
jgi:hypothetical protein